ncbi:Putative peptidoglycan binding domain-containing protein, partial [Candidatus Kryptonium thompsonii]
LHKLYFFKSDPKNLVKIDDKICRELQQIMKDRGFYDGPVNGIFDEKTKKSLQNFMGWENYDVRIRDDDMIDLEVLQDIRKNYEVWKSQRKVGK